MSFGHRCRLTGMSRLTFPGGFPADPEGAVTCCSSRRSSCAEGGGGGNQRGEHCRPAEPSTEDYTFQSIGEDGNQVNVRLSDLFAAGKDSLLIYSMMFPRHPTDDRPGPTVGETAKLPPARRPMPFVQASSTSSRAPPSTFRPAPTLSHQRRPRRNDSLPLLWERGWRRLRFVSSAGNTYNRDYGAELPDGSANADAERVPPRR